MENEGQLFERAASSVRVAEERFDLIVIRLEVRTSEGRGAGAPPDRSLLREASRRLLDGIGTTGAVAWAGEQEFAIVLPGHREASDLARRATRLIAYLNEPPMRQGSKDGTEYINASARIALCRRAEGRRGILVLDCIEGSP
jgi:hypothetical protein